jgi:LPS-assembly lipoprotein
MTPISNPHSPISGQPLTGATGVAAERRALLRGLAGAGVVLSGGLLTGCGFALRQAPTFAFDSVRVSNYENSPVSRALQRALAASDIRVLNSSSPAAQEAQVVLAVLVDQRERAVVGQTAAGQVRELQLRTRFRFSLSTTAGKSLIESTEMLLERDISFTETAALAKASEEYMMFNDMQGDIVQQVMRRLAAVKSL